jgi:hypothetical protein
MTLQANWLTQLRHLHDGMFSGIDWQAAVRELNVRVGDDADHPFSLVVTGAPPPLFNGDVERIRPGRWALVISLNHQLGEHHVDIEPQTLWDYWRNYNRQHWYPRFFEPITRLVWTAFDDAQPDLPSEYAASHILFVELCPYASSSFSLPPDLVSDLVQTEPGFRLAAQANRLVMDEAGPAFVLVNGSAACQSFEAEFGDALSWQYQQYSSSPLTSGGRAKTLWHYEGLLHREAATTPVVGFPFLRTARTHNSNAEIDQLGRSIRALVQGGSSTDAL